MKRMSSVWWAVGLAAMFTGCVVEDVSRDALEMEEERGEGGEQKPGGSCVDTNCDEQSAGGCWCDDKCSEYEDCCDDYEPVCVDGGETGGEEAGEEEGAEAGEEAGEDGPGDDGMEPMGCEGFCGGVSPDMCSCEEGCKELGTCCSDYEEACTAPDCTLNVVLMGYWPPTNEMLREWSTNPEQNPSGWVGENWNGHGYDVYSYFPEFPPDGDPTNDGFGSEGRVGSPDFDLQVDYQATSEDFWRIVDDTKPTILITTSRGGGIGWELEALEGGHGGWGNPANDWSSDGYGDVHHPTMATVTDRTWEAISTWRGDATLPSKLPFDEITAAVDEVSDIGVEVDYGTSGNYLSGFMGLHGLAYAESNPNVLAAGHIHVGGWVSNEDAREAMVATLEAVLKKHPTLGATCPGE